MSDLSYRLRIVIDTRVAVDAEPVGVLIDELGKDGWVGGKSLPQTMRGARYLSSGQLPSYGTQAHLYAVWTLMRKGRPSAPALAHVAEVVEQIEKLVQGKDAANGVDFDLGIV